MRSQSDADLLLALREPGAFEKFYARHVDAVFGFARRRCARPEDVADLVSLTFLEAARSAHTFKPHRGQARPWLLGIATRCLADLRSAEYRQGLLLDRLGPEVEPASDEYEAIERQIDAAALAAPLREALEFLTPAERDVLELVAFDDLSVAEASRALGLSPVAGRMRLARARRRVERAMRHTRTGQLQPPCFEKPEEAR